jgi:3',5'-cyclic AMP phosphodiesterase CpdA
MTELDGLVQRVRQSRYEKILDQCGNLRMLNIPQKVELPEMYVDVYVLKDRPSQEYQEISDLYSSCNEALRRSKPDSERFDRFGLSERYQREPGIGVVSEYPKLMILGKPGAGKTTFLKHITVKCQKGEFQPNLIPIFIKLKDFSEDLGDCLNSETTIFLQNYISSEFFSDCSLNEDQTETILKQGRALILLDGLDEVSDKNDDETIKQIRRFVNTFHKNRFVITCRIAAKKYRLQQENFDEIEVADFNPKQVNKFVYNWFAAVDKKTSVAETMAEQFIEKLSLPEHKTIRELAVTPILLNLTCLVFQANADFPSERTELYRRGLNILLFKWDEERGIKRDEIYRNLSVIHKEQLLSELASATFEQGDYFFEQEKIQQLIAKYLSELLDPQPEPVDSEAVLRSIEAQHGLLVERAQGIYSFSHLTFQEYLTARSFINNLRNNNFRSETLKPLFTEWGERWREVFLLVTGMLTVDDLLNLKLAIDELVTSNNKLQQFLRWVNQKSLSTQTTFKPAAVRALYFGFTFSLHKQFNDYSLARRLDYSLDDLIDTINKPNFSSISNFDIFIDFNLSIALTRYYDTKSSLRIISNLLNYNLVSELAQSLRGLENQLSDFAQREQEIYRGLEQQVRFRIQPLATRFIPVVKSEIWKRLKNLISLLEKVSPCNYKSYDSYYKSYDSYQDIFNMSFEEIKECDRYRSRYQEDWQHEYSRYQEDWQQLQRMFNELYQVVRRNNKNLQDWVNQLKGTIKHVLTQHCDIGHDWQFNDDQKTSLQAYYFGNLLLVELLKNNVEVSPEVREKVESTLLLPITKDDAKSDHSQCKRSNSSQLAQTFRACSLMHILHLSDLHFGTSENPHNWYNQLAEDLYQELNCPRLDALILSGDIANKSTPEEYKVAKDFLDKLCQEFQLQPEQIVIVPGNHDLNWGLAKKAYKLIDRDEYEGELKEGYYIQESQSVIRIRDEKKYKQRFAHFSNFYQSIKDESYPLEYEQQGILHHLPEQNLLILGLNSAWQLDHYYKSRASINADALNQALTDIRRNQAYKDCLKLAVWHHPLNSAFEDRITDHGFMEQLAKAGFRFALHGHIHKAETSLYRYDHSVGGRKLDIVCAGTFGAPIREWVPGYPLQYNLLKLENNKLTVETRRREELNGAWQPDARWLQGAGKNPLPHYEIEL